MARKPAKAAQKGFEETLWDSANKLRGSVESSEYKHIVLSLIFLKFISDKFEERKAVIENEYGAGFVDMVDFYTMENVFYLPEEFRWSFVQSIKFVDSHKGNRKDISIYGQEYTSTTYKLAKMNLAIRGIAANLGDVAGDTFFKDQHPDLKADFTLALPLSFFH